MQGRSVNWPPTRRPDWRDLVTRWNHFLEHGRQLGVRTVEEYDDSVEETLRYGKRFEYNDPKTRAPRVGYFDRSSFRFVGLTVSERVILTHFVAREDYVRGLPNSTY
jgi:hypothetical protein